MKQHSVMGEVFFLLKGHVGANKIKLLSFLPHAFGKEKYTKKH